MNDPDLCFQELKERYPKWHLPASAFFPPAPPKTVKKEKTDKDASAASANGKARVIPVYSSSLQSAFFTQTGATKYGLKEKWHFKVYLSSCGNLQALLAWIHSFCCDVPVQRYTEIHIFRLFPWQNFVNYVASQTRLHSVLIKRTIMTTVFFTNDANPNIRSHIIPLWYMQNVHKVQIHHQLEACIGTEWLPRQRHKRSLVWVYKGLGCMETWIVFRGWGWTNPF